MELKTYQTVSYTHLDVYKRQMFLMLGIMLQAFLLAMYEKDGLPFEKVVRNIIRAKFLRAGIRAYRT